MMPIVWPKGKKFAFTVFDDTDRATLQNVREVYDFLYGCGLKTTKSVWPLAGGGLSSLVGSTCAEPDYLAWVLELKRKGFEIAFHNARSESSSREVTIKGLDKFKILFDGNPESMVNHMSCQENIYWGSERLTGIYKKLYNILTFNRRKGQFRGHLKGDAAFWGDLCLERIKYVRNFVYDDINTLKLCPFMPYHDPLRSYVKYWFVSSHGGDVRAFSNCVSEENQDRLADEGGACIMYAHFADGFQEGSSINPRFKHLLERLAKKNGWFVPVSVLLDYLCNKNSAHVITDSERAVLERKWMLRKIIKGTD